MILGHRLKIDDWLMVINQYKKTRRSQLMSSNRMRLIIEYGSKDEWHGLWVGH